MSNKNNSESKKRITTLEELIDYRSERLLKINEKNGIRRIEVYMYLAQENEIRYTIKSAKCRDNYVFVNNAKMHVFKRMEEQLNILLEEEIKKGIENSVSLEDTLKSMEKANYLEETLELYSSLDLLKEPKSRKVVKQKLNEFLKKFVETERKKFNIQEEDILEKNNDKDTSQPKEDTFFEKVSQYTNEFSFLAYGKDKYNSISGHTKSVKFNNREEYFRFKDIENEINNKLSEYSRKKEIDVIRDILAQDMIGTEKLQEISSKIEEKKKQKSKDNIFDVIDECSVDEKVDKVKLAILLSRMNKLQKDERDR